MRNKWALIVVVLVITIALVGCAALRAAQERRETAQADVESKERDIATAEATEAPEAELLRLWGELAAAEKERDQAQEEVKRLKGEVKEDALGWITFVGPSLLAMAGIRLPKTKTG